MNDKDTPITPATNPDQENKYLEGYRENSRKTKAFYVSMLAIIGLFLYGDYRHVETKDIIGNVTNLALAYIVGVAAADSVRYYKYGSNTLGNPEKSRLKDRYQDK